MSIVFLHDDKVVKYVDGFMCKSESKRVARKLEFEHGLKKKEITCMYAKDYRQI
ncbi:MAG: hypothetical protein HQL30_12620 [Candidatus Omnitrophica bacterium]|nr:hypothetical protein [Candidatus Omnitrophota bacterium]